MPGMSMLNRWLGARPTGPQDEALSSDWALWRKACGGCGRSARDLVEMLTPQAFSLALQMLGQREDAQDAVQDAFMRLWRSDPADNRGARLATYFNTIVINRCRTQLSARKEGPVSLDALADESADDGADGGVRTDQALLRDGASPDAPDQMAARQAREGIEVALAGLPVRQRMVLVMWAYADATPADIARVLDIDPNAAHQLLHRARHALRGRLPEGIAP